MPEETQKPAADLMAVSVSIVMAYVVNNSLPVAELPALVGIVHCALASLTNTTVAETLGEDAVAKPTPAQIRKSVTRDEIISFLDGKAYKTLKRHLGAHGLDPHSYRERYGLPVEYPMVAPSYSEKRRDLAKTNGLRRVGGRAKGPGT